MGEWMGEWVGERVGEWVGEWMGEWVGEWGEGSPRNADDGIQVCISMFH